MRSLARPQEVTPTALAHPGSRFIEQAALASEHLTSDPVWNVFLQRVQAMVAQERATLAAMAEHIGLPNLTAEQILQAQRHMVAAKSRIEAWEIILNLPKELIEARKPAETPT